MSRTKINVTTEEAKRQLQYIQNLKEFVQEQKQKLGRPLFYALSTFGCPLISTTEIFNPLSINGIRTSGLTHF